MYQLSFNPLKYLPALYKLCLIGSFIFNLNTPVSCQINPNISALLNQQQELWNKGDIPGFMEFYKKDNSTSFVSSSGINYGWNEILDRYKAAYPDKKSMGTLQFKILDSRALGVNNYLVLGQYVLQYEDAQASGYFSLVWELLDGQWRIISDHTSASVKKN